MKLYRALGLMSGTSIDGIDAALIETDGEDIVRPLGCWSFPYDEPFRVELRAAIAAARGLVDRAARPGVLAAVESALTRRHADAVEACLNDGAGGGAAIDVIGFHGQTVLHRPHFEAARPRVTVQLGDGAQLARLTGTMVVHDLRAADFEAGGEGAPLVPVYHRALAADIPVRPLALLNIGGVANVTWIGRSVSGSASTDELIAFDTGPGNAPIDDWTMASTGQAFDDDGALARRGKADEKQLALLLSDPYFVRPAPKSLDRDAFAVLAARAVSGLSPADGAATLTQFTARAVERCLSHLPHPPRQWIVAGGGRHNGYLRECLVRALGAPVLTAEAVGMNGTSIEAEAWAYLAVRALKGLPLTFPGTTGVARPLPGGRISHPANVARAVVASDGVASAMFASATIASDRGTR